MQKIIIFLIGVGLILSLIYFFLLDLPKPEKYYSYFNTVDIYENAYKKVPDIKSKASEIKGLIINHHLFAGKFMAEILEYAKTSEPKTVIILSPNHFSYGQKAIQVGNVDFITPYGELKSNTRVGAKIDEFENDSFKLEHGVSGIVPFIKKSIPNAKIVPIMFKDTVNQKDAEDFALKLYKVIPENSLIIASLDFAHYTQLNLARFQDRMSLASILNFEIDKINKINIDSRPTLQIMLKLMELYEYGKFNLVTGSSSSILLNDYKTLENTSYITGYFTKGESDKVKSTNILISNLNYDFAPEPQRFISGADYLFANTSEEKFNTLPLYYKKYNAKPLENFNGSDFMLKTDGKCSGENFQILVLKNSTQNSVEYSSNCLRIEMTNMPNYDLGINLGSNGGSVYFLPSILLDASQTDMLKTNLEFHQGIATFNY